MPKRRILCTKKVTGFNKTEVDQSGDRCPRPQAKESSAPTPRPAAAPGPSHRDHRGRNPCSAGTRPPPSREAARGSSNPPSPSSSNPPSPSAKSKAAHLGAGTCQRRASFSPRSSAPPRPTLDDHEAQPQVPPPSREPMSMILGLRPRTRGSSACKGAPHRVIVSPVGAPG